jgi:hypothetical protein
MPDALVWHPMADNKLRGDRKIAYVNKETDFILTEGFLYLSSLNGVM